MKIRENWSRTKEVLGAYFRQGLNELGSVFYGGGTAAQPSQYGMIATRTPGEVADGLRGIQSGIGGQDGRAPSVLEEHLGRAEERTVEREPERQDPQIERD